MRINYIVQSIQKLFIIHNDEEFFEKFEQQKQLEMLQLTESARNFNGGFLNNSNENEASPSQQSSRFNLHLQDCHGDYGLEESLSPELVLMSHQSCEPITMCSKRCSFFDHTSINELPFVQDAYYLSNHIDQLLSQKMEEHLNEDRGHCSTKDHSFHLEKDDLTLMLEQENMDFKFNLITSHLNQQDHIVLESDLQRLPSLNKQHLSIDSELLSHPLAKTKDIKKQKHRHQITKCGHDDQPYYANGMCQNCYHAKGRTKKATKCEHTDRALYAKGICKNCYLSIYHKKKRSDLRTTVSNMSSGTEQEEISHSTNQQIVNQPLENRLTLNSSKKDSLVSDSTFQNTIMQ